MYCPQCGTSQSEELRFCKLCGANLHAVRQVVATRETEEKFDWSKTWVAEMFMSEGERKRREQEIERQRGITPEVKRYQEIKAGVITSSVGVGVSIFLYFLMQGIILSGQSPPSDAAILGRIWIAGVIPFFVGLGLMINGLFVSKKMVEAVRKEARWSGGPAEMCGAAAREASLQLPDSADTAEFSSPDFSVTEGTTKHLRSTERRR